MNRAQALLLSLAGLLIVSQGALAEVERKKFTTSTHYLLVEVLDDDLVHIEMARGEGPSIDDSLYTSPMVFKTDYDGPNPSGYSAEGNVIETTDVRVEVNPANLCCTFRDKRQNSRYLTSVCGTKLGKAFKGINVDPGQIENVYGLGQQFVRNGSADGDWTRHGVRVGEGQLGNGFVGFHGGAVGNVQIPVMYAVGSSNLNYALFLDNVYHQKWDFQKFWWEVRMFGDQVRFYFMTGPDLIDLRADYMELTGRPPVPPRKAFGLWVSEFGYDNWDQIDALRDGLRSHRFPVDGFVLDLNWFGGVVLKDPPKSKMGRLDWDEEENDGNGYFFPDPEEEIPDYADDHIGLAVIEESYIAKPTTTFDELPADLSSYRSVNGTCNHADQSNPADGIKGFWGEGRMVDWSDPKARRWIHENRRFPNLVEHGVHVHWTDLGEPETFDGSACYEGVEITESGRKNKHPDIHNLYNLLWNKSIWDGYFEKRVTTDDPELVNPRPFILTRSGAAGTQRFGAGMWSGDIASNLNSLATHLNAQLHMSFSGIDYYGADVGGFRREALPQNNKQGKYRGYEGEMYTQWFANACWFDVPVRPHTDNEFISVDPPYETAPDRVGNLASNLANLRQRYELTPYYYSLAYEAHLRGRPVVAPLVFYEQNDARARQVGHEKLVGRNVLVAVVARHGEYERDVYLPEGDWYNYHTNEFHIGGQTVRDVPVYRDGQFRLPVFVRAGAILPMMRVDEQTKDVFGHRLDDSPPSTDLMVQVAAHRFQTVFTLYEDDGATLSYDGNGRPQYHHRRTNIRQLRSDQGGTAVIIERAKDHGGTEPFTGAVTARSNVVKLLARHVRASSVTLNGQPLNEVGTPEALDAAESGWCNADENLILAKSGPMDVYETSKEFHFLFEPIQPTTSVNFVCFNGVTTPGASIYVVGTLPQLGDNDPVGAVKLDPSVYYQYIVDGRGHEGIQAVPVWTGVISGLPRNTEFQWRCVRKREDGTGTPELEPGSPHHHETSSAGYSGRGFGSF
jgi:alpha-glucosidase